MKQAPPARLVVALPALDEEATLGSVIHEIPRTIPGVDEIEVLVVDDGSVDRTAQIARALGATVIRHSETRGAWARPSRRPSATRSGLERICS